MTDLIKVTDAKALGARRLWLRFSDGRAGIRDMSDLLDEGGPMVEPLRDPAMFQRVFVQFGVPAWPNGLDLDAVVLRRELEAAGLLSDAVAA